MSAVPLIQTNLINDANLLHYYKMNGNSNDNKGTADGTDTNVTYSGIIVPNSNFADSGTYNGVTSITKATIASGLSGSFTLMGWAYVTSAAEDSIMESNVNSYNNYWAYGSNNQGGKFSWNLFDGTHNPNMIGGTTVSNATWYQFAFVRDTVLGKILLYVNGASDATAVTDTTTIVPGYSAFGMGGRTEASSAKLTGNLTDLSIFSRALTSSEISGYYNGTLPSPGISLLSLLGVG